jgi:hypothetical protein
MPTMKRQEDDLPIESDLSRGICAALDVVCEWQMGLPLLLLLVSHRPLAFMAGQLLMLALPLNLLLPGLSLRAWADLLSHPQGPVLLQRRLAEGTVPPVSRR